MWRRTNIVRITLAIVVLVGLGTALAQKAAVPKPQDKLALGENEVKQLLLLMDSDRSGKISKQEWMTRKGQLNVKELTQSKLRVRHPVSVGK